MQLPGAVLLGLQVINEKRDWTVWSLSYQFGHQLLQDQSKAESSWMSARPRTECGQRGRHPGMLRDQFGVFFNFTTIRGRIEVSRAVG